MYKYGISLISLSIVGEWSGIWQIWRGTKSPWKPRHVPHLILEEGGGWIPKIGPKKTACHGNPGNHGNVARGEMVLEWFYPLVNQHNYGKSQFSMGKSTINGHFQTVSLPCLPDRVHCFALFDLQTWLVLTKTWWCCRKHGEIPDFSDGHFTP